MTSSVLSEVEALELAKRSKATAAYRRLVESLANGEPLSAAKTLATIEAAGKTSADLAAAVEAKRTRLELAAQVARVPDLERQLAERSARVGAAVAAATEAAQSRDAVIEEEKDHIRALERAINSAADCREALRKSCDDEALLSELADLRDARCAFGGQQRVSKANLRPDGDGPGHNYARLLADTEAARAKGKWDEVARLEAKRVEFHRRMIATNEQKLEEATERLAEIDQRESEILLAMERP